MSRFRSVLVIALVAWAGACKPKIGDDCKISTDCSAAGDRLCDITAPGGYCTMFNCEPGSCPDGESLCVEFGAQRASAEQCQDQHAPSPYARAFCMRTCDDTSDCRGGYECADLSRSPNSWDAVLIDKGRGNKACVAPFREPSSTETGSGSAEEQELGQVGDVCVSKLPNPQAAPSQGGSAGSGGVGGAAGSGGAGGFGGSGDAPAEAGAAGQGGGG